MGRGLPALLFTLALLLGIPAKADPHARICQRVDASLLQARDWAVKAQTSNGLFTYEYFPARAAASQNDNIVRQIGMFWALVRTQARYPNADAREAIERFRIAILDHAVRAQADGEPIAYIDHEGIGKLNAVALYTLALLEMQETGIALTEEESALLPLLVSGMRLMADEKGGFWYIYFLPSERNLITAYGTGEALYALAKYYNGTQNRAGLEWVYAQFQIYFERFFIPMPAFSESHAQSFFSWGVYALREISRKRPVPYDQYIKPMVEGALDFRANNPICRDRGCLVHIKASDAVFLEGLIEAHAMAVTQQADQAHTQPLRHYIEQSLKQTLDLQITDIEAVERRIGTAFGGHPNDVLGAFCELPNCAFIRNDINQHAMIALMHYQDQFCD